MGPLRLSQNEEKEGMTLRRATSVLHTSPAVPITFPAGAHQRPAAGHSRPPSGDTMPRYKQPADISPGHKFCIACKAVLPVANFSPEKVRKDGLRPYCKPCASRRVQVSKARRRYLATVGKLATNPARVSPAEREALDAAFAAAWSSIDGGMRTATLAKRQAMAASHH